MRIIYTAGIRFYLLLIRIVSLGNPRARKLLRGRRGLFRNMKRELPSGEQYIWFHCASLGEFEQGRPLMERMKKEDPSCKILLTFYSPSGYEIRKNYEGADYVYYLPADTPEKVRRFLDLVNPKAVFFIKYEFWFNFLDEIGKRGIPAFLVSGIFREEQHFFKWYGSWFREKLKSFKRFYIQDEASAALLERFGFTNVLVSGDTRFDRVLEIAADARELPMTEAFKGNKKLIVAGSTWEADEELLLSLQPDTSGYKLLIAPHEIGEEEVAASVRRFESKYRVMTWSGANKSNVKDSEILIVDNIGMLSSLYRYGDIAYIGGGFGEGIHNILEAAVCGLPVIFGPNYEKFSEANELIAAGGAFCVRDTTELRKVFALLTDDPHVIQIASEISRNYVRKKSGATSRIYEDYGKQMKK
jgi:3-deoxy-D-manno-octulosonic-acid transferase